MPGRPAVAPYAARTSVVRFPAPFAAPLLAAGMACVAGHASHAATLTVAVNHSVRLPVAGRAASVVVGNAAVADVTVVDTHTLFVTGKAPGSTDVAVVDPLGRTVFATDVWVSSGAGAPVTVHRASTTSELACDPRCVAPDQAKPTGMAAVLQGIGEMAATRAAATSAMPQINPPVMTTASPFPAGGVMPPVG